MKRLTSVLLTLLLLLPCFAWTDATEETADPDAVTISQSESSDTYKDMLMDSLDQTVLSDNDNIRSQLMKILYLDDVTVDANAYNTIVAAVQNAIHTEQLSEGASLDSYTEADLEIAVDLIRTVCEALDLDFSIDPSNDSQNEYARVITISKNGTVLGKINSDAKTDTVNTPSILWLIAGGTILLSAVIVGLYLFSHKRNEA